MDRVVGDFEEERAARMAGDEAHGAPGDLIGQVSGGLDRRRILVKIGRPTGRTRVVVVGAAQEPEEFVEPVGVRPELGFPAEVPFAEESRRISVRLEKCR